MKIGINLIKKINNKNIKTYIPPYGIILNNLISNGVKYNKINGVVKVSAKKKENQLELSVTDSGIGISKDELSKLFKEFNRIKNEKTKNILGSGLGLSTIKKIAQLYNGDVTVESNPNIGSTFTIVLNL